MSEGKNEIKVQLFEVAAFIGQELEDVIDSLQGSFPDKNWTQNSKIKTDEEFSLLEKHFKSRSIREHFEEEMLAKQTTVQKLIDEENAKNAAAEAARVAEQERIAKEKEMMEENAKRAIAEAEEAARIAEQERLEQIAKQEAEAEKQNNPAKEEIIEEKIETKEEETTEEEKTEIEEPTTEISETSNVIPQPIRKIDLPDKKKAKKPAKAAVKPETAKSEATSAKAKPETAKSEATSAKAKPETAKSETTSAKAKPETAKSEVKETVQTVEPEVAAKKTEDDNLIKHQSKDIEEAVQLRKIDLAQFKKPKYVAPKREDKKPPVQRTPVQRTADGKRQRSAPKDAKVDPKKYANQHRDRNLRPVTPPDEVAVQKALKENLERMKNQGRKSKTSIHNRDKRREHAERREQTREQQVQENNILKISEFITANELATLMGKPVKDIIKVCMDLGQLVGINQRLDAEIIKFLAEEFGFEVEFVTAEITEDIDDEDKDTPEDLKPRAPIVTVMGHVDHGKTSLLDYIRKTNVIAGEAGGITQSIGAYEVSLPDGRNVTFLDTPGHEAFTAMRARGAKLTDIAIIVVAANEKVMPQTVEAINHAQAGNLPIVFAITKIDMPGADPTRIKQQLAEMNLLVEEWGGSYQSHDIDAKHGTGVAELLEKVLIQAEIMELKANPNKRAKGTIVEASLDKGRGYVSNVLIQEGSINVGDYILAGTTYGRVKAMFNERNEKITKAGPSKPIVLLGLNGAPQAGDNFRVTKDERTAKDKANELSRIQREMSIRTQKHLTLEEIGRRISLGTFKELNIIVKADVDGSVEAVSDALLKLSTPQVQVNIIHKGVGQIVEGDVSLAIASDAVIIGFQVRPSQQAKKMAEAEQIDIRLYSVIYKATEELKDALEGMLEPETVESIVPILKFAKFSTSQRSENIAGCMVLDGKINRNTKVRIIRDGIVGISDKRQDYR